MLKRQTVQLYIAVYLLGLCLAVTAIGQKKIADLKPTVILISLDGFRYDYLDKYRAADTEQTRERRRAGKVDDPVIPTKTFPNHYTMVTGSLPEHHGIVENNVYDFGEVFMISDRKACAGESLVVGRAYLGDCSETGTDRCIVFLRWLGGAGHGYAPAVLARIQR
jgi:hypothetical protein